MNTVLAARQLAFERNDRPLFRQLDFAIERGEVLQIEGRNGCGKTTLLRVLCGLSQPSEGELLWNGSNVREVLPEYLGELAYVGHLAGLKEDLTPYENLEAAAAIGRGAGLEPLAALDRVALPAGHEEVSVRTLSAGQRRRVALARLLVSGATLWIADEPFTALDRQGRQLVEELLSEHAAAGGMAVLTTHHAVELDGCTVRNLHLG